MDDQLWKRQQSCNNLKEIVVSINRVSKVVKGGKRFSLSALVVVGNKAGKVGCGIGKAKEVQVAIKKGASHASKHMVSVKLKGSTIPHEIIGISGAGKILLKPASLGTGVIACGAVRAVLEAAGVKDILTKSMRSSNSFNVVYATINALKKLRSIEEIAKIRDKKVSEIW
ncbi:MAG: 30S ribosomal protein S5 [Endomicrobium sp.]|nr:30S ribosomal protein S5 [Endomicrobium sp.]